MIWEVRGGGWGTSCGVVHPWAMLQCNVYVWFCVKHLYRVKHTVCICQMSDTESVLQTINGKILKRVAKRKVVFACGILQCHLYLWCKYQVVLCLIFFKAHVFVWSRYIFPCLCKATYPTSTSVQHAMSLIYRDPLLEERKSPSCKCVFNPDCSLNTPGHSVIAV